MRRWRRISALAGSLAVCLPPHLLWKLSGRHSPWPRRFLAMAARSVGARVRVAGQPLRQDVFYVANHISWVDILAMGGASGCAFVSHAGVAQWPLVGWLAAQNNTVFVAREKRHQVNGQLAAMRAALAGHQPVALFPEGTTSDGHRLLPFKAPLFASLMPPPRSILIQPVHVNYGDAAPEIAWTGAEPAGSNAKRLLERDGTLPLTLHFLEPFDPADYPDRKAIAAEARKRIEACLPPSARREAAV